MTVRFHRKEIGILVIGHRHDDDSLEIYQQTPVIITRLRRIAPMTNGSQPKRMTIIIVRRTKHSMSINTFKETSSVRRALSRCIGSHEDVNLKIIRLFRLTLLCVAAVISADPDREIVPIYQFICQQRISDEGYAARCA